MKEGGRVRGYWRGAAGWLALWLVLAAIAAAAFGPVPALAALAAWLLLLHARQLWHMDALLRWLDQPPGTPVPHGSGIWSEAFSYLARLMRRQRQNEADLRSALERFQSATAAMNEAVIILDELDRIEWCNPSAEHYFEIDARRDLGRQLTYIVRQPQFVEFAQELGCLSLQLSRRPNTEKQILFSSNFVI